MTSFDEDRARAAHPSSEGWSLLERECRALEARTFRDQSVGFAIFLIGVAGFAVLVSVTIKLWL